MSFAAHVLTLTITTLTHAADRKRLAKDTAVLLLPSYSDSETPAPADSGAGAKARTESGA